MPSEPATHTEATFPILSRFFEFWETVETLRQQLQADQAFEPAAANVRAQLADVLRKQKSELAPAQGPSALFEEAQYVMAATADDVFIHMEWNGAEDWRRHPLEAELFGTRSAGQEVFRRIDRLTDGSAPDGHGMAAVCLTALELGFKGQYDGEAHHETLEAKGRELRKLVGRAPRPMGLLVRQCYDHTSKAGTELRLPGSRGWWWATVAVVCVALVVSAIVMFTRSHGASIEAARRLLEADLARVEGPR